MDEGELDRPITGALGRYTRDLTRDARDGRLESVRCRDEEVARVIDILLRQGKNNPALVGPAGVGKTAIAEALAQRLVGGDVPLALRSTRLLALDHVSLLAGSTYRGQYEERIRALVNETSSDPDVVLFVDELHNLIGQGTAIGVAMDAANMLKPSLVRGDFRVIGATTDEEYDRWIRGDPALERRFQRVLVRELTTEETFEVLRARLERLERHHNVVIADDAIRASVELTDVHMLDRRRPDRAIDVLDEACAHAQAVTRYSPRAEAMVLRRRELLRERRDRRAGHASAERRARADRRDPSPGAAWESRGAAPGGSASDSSLGSGDDFESLARGGLEALQRFGAELESIFTASPASVAREARGEQDAREAREAREMREASESGAEGGSGESGRANANQAIATSIAEGAADAIPAATSGSTAGATAAATASAAASATAGATPAAPPRASSLAVLEVELRSLLIEDGVVVRGLDVARVVALATGHTVRWSE
ncbi:MAG: ATP-dependent Clp protease ATP-binding subunit [Gemmatimonadaceae bacterium]|nr:ATP-dependent Clp protease ATP-binding subunit [Gemmatimonadaceae bacterium]